MTSFHDRTDAFVRSLGFEAYRVGGSVRDELLERRSKDSDYVVRAEPWEMENRARFMGAKTSKLQLRDGTVVGARAHVRGLGLIEMAMPRTEVSTGPTHGDFKIVTEPTLSLDQDAERRDFTFNALYLPVHNGARSVIDPTGQGLADLRGGWIRTTHPTSFRDDPLRILRAARFMSQLGFSPAPGMLAEMIEHRDAVNGLTDKGVSGTALAELSKLLMGTHVANALRLLTLTGVLPVLLPEVSEMIGFEQESRYHSKTVDEHTFEALDVAARIHAPLRVRLALLFHDAGKPGSAWRGEDGRLHYYANLDLRKPDHEEVGALLAGNALRRLNAPRDLRDDVETLVRRHMLSLSGRTKESKIRRWRAELGDDLFADLIRHRFCDVLAKEDDHENPSDDGRQAVAALARMERIREEARDAGVPTNVKDLAISGGELKAMGFEGRQIGEAQRALLHDVLAQPDLNDPETLRRRAEKIKPPTPSIAPRPEVGAEEQIVPDDRPHPQEATHGPTN